jgi:hypothetical protein
MVLGAIFECGKTKFLENFTICALDGIKAILKNTLKHLSCTCFESAQTFS